MNADIKAVEATVRTYLDGLYEGDAEKLAHVFHPTSALTTARDDGAIVGVASGLGLVVNFRGAPLFEFRDGAPRRRTDDRDPRALSGRLRRRRQRNPQAAGHRAAR